jgi:hypothetical protein
MRLCAGGRTVTVTDWDTWKAKCEACAWDTGWTTYDDASRQLHEHAFGGVGVTCAVHRPLLVVKETGP